MALAPPHATFLHTTWRSGGTWLWSALRDSPDALGFYEPFHERMAELTAAIIPSLHPGEWESGHPDGRPYFEEYGPLLHPEGGVRLFHPRFTHHDGFAAPPLDPAIERYLRQLTDRAAAAGRVAVVKFCRSMGRAAAIREAFPEALHLALLREPLAQWRSVARQWTRHGNRYFLLQPTLALAGGADSPLVAEIADRLGAPLARLPPQALPRAQDWFWRWIRHHPWATRYRSHLALWLATAIAAAEAGLPLLDPADTHALLPRLAEAGLHPTLHPNPPRQTPAGPREGRALDLAAAHGAALTVLRARPGLPPEAARHIAASLGRAIEPDLAATRRIAPRLPSPRSEPWAWWVERPVRFYSRDWLFPDHDQAGDLPMGD